jgi:hypothetical protein
VEDDPEGVAFMHFSFVPPFLSCWQRKVEDDPAGVAFMHFLLPRLFLVGGRGKWRMILQELHLCTFVATPFLSWWQRKVKDDPEGVAFMHFLLPPFS